MLRDILQNNQSGKSQGCESQGKIKEIWQTTVFGDLASFLIKNIIKTITKLEWD